MKKRCLSLALLSSVACAPDQPSIVPTSGRLVVPFSVSIDAAGGASPIGAIALQEGTGTVTTSGSPLSTAAYAAAPGFVDGESIVISVALDASRVHVYFYYCDAGASLPVLYYENSMDGPLTRIGSTGTCAVGPETTTESVALPASTIVVPTLARAISVSGSDVSYDGSGPGRIRVGSRVLTLYPFQAVNCTRCGSPGWYELHALLWDADAHALTFAILYFTEGEDGMQLEYPLTLPGLDGSVKPQRFAARWGVDPSFAIGAATPDDDFHRVASGLRRHAPRRRERRPPSPFGPLGLHSLAHAVRFSDERPPALNAPR